MRVPNGRRTRRVTAAPVVATAVIAALALGGCSNSRSTSAANSAGSSSASSSSCDLSAFTSAKTDWRQQKGATIELAVEEHPWWETVKPLIPCFEKLTGITVKTSVLGENQFVSKLPTELSGGSSTPDVFMVNQLGQAQGSGWLETLDPYLNNPKLTDQSWYNAGDFFQGAQDFAKLDGKFTALPITAEAQMLFVRDDLVPTPPKAIDDLIAAAAAANKGSVAGFSARAVADANQTPWPFGGFAFSDGGQYLDSSGAPHLDSAANVTAAKQYAELISKYGPAGASGWGFLENEQAMQQGKLAMWTDSSTFLGALKDTSKSVDADKISAYAFPTGASGKSLPNAWYWTAGMNAKSQNKDAAWLFLEWATSEPISEQGAANGASPARQAAWSSPYATKSIGADNAKRVKDAIASVDSSYMATAWKNPKWSQVADPLARAINSVVTGTDAQSTLGGAQKTASSILGK